MQQYDYHDPDDSLEDFSGITGFLVLLVILAFIAVTTILDFFSKIPRGVYWTVLVGAAMLFESWFIRWELAQAVAMTCTLIVAVLAVFIPGLRLENENCKSRSVFRLWRKTKLLPFHTGLMFVFELFVVIAALFVHFSEASIVHWPGVIATLIVFPLLTYSIGYFTVQSYHRYT